MFVDPFGEVFSPLGATNQTILCEEAVTLADE